MILTILGVGAALLGGAALLSSDDDDSDYETEERNARLRAANERRHREAMARKRAAAQREARHRQEAREDFERLASTKLREFKMKTRLCGNFRLVVGDCAFTNFATDTKAVSMQVKKVIESRLQPMREEREDYSAKIKELKAIVSLLESQGTGGHVK